MKSLSSWVAAPAARVALAIAILGCGGVLGCGGRVEVGGPSGGTAGASGATGAAGAGGAAGSQGGGGAAQASCESAIGTPCECGSFSLCPSQTVLGIPCCGIAKFCSGEDTCVVAWTGAVCMDWCDTSCEQAQDKDQCVTIGCQWTSNGCATP